MILKDRDLCKNKKDYDFHSENHSPFVIRFGPVFALTK